MIIIQTKKNSNEEEVPEKKEPSVVDVVDVALGGVFSFFFALFFGENIFIFY